MKNWQPYAIHPTLGTIPELTLYQPYFKGSAEQKASFCFDPEEIFASTPRDADLTDTFTQLCGRRIYIPGILDDKNQNGSKILRYPTFVTDITDLKIALQTQTQTCPDLDVTKYFKLIIDNNWPYAVHRKSKAWTQTLNNLNDKNNVLPYDSGSIFPSMLQRLTCPLRISSPLYLVNYGQPFCKTADEIAQRVVSQALTAGMLLHDFHPYTGYTLQELINEIYKDQLSEEIYFLLTKKFQIRIDPNLVIPEFGSDQLKPFLQNLFEAWGGTDRNLARVLGMSKSKFNEMKNHGPTLTQYNRLVDFFRHSFPGDYLL